MYVTPHLLYITFFVFNFKLVCTYVVYEDDVTFFLHTRNDIEVQITNNTLSKIDGTKKFVFIIHGWQASHNKTYFAKMTAALLRKEDLNVIQVDWSKPAAVSDHDIAANNTKAVGYFVGSFVLKLFRHHSIKPNQIHLVGHSLGAHVAGFAAKEVKKSSARIYRITGLDPARSPFENTTDINEKLYREDADAVVVVHTDRGARGFVESIGTIDFFPNNGTSPQPGCEGSEEGEDLCSHNRSHAFFIEAIENPHGFVSTLCDSFQSYRNGSCDFNERLPLGGVKVDNSTGNFYLETNADTPFSKQS